MLVTLSALKSFPVQLEQLFGEVPSDYRHWTPETWDGIPSESFTAIEQICHVRDIEVLGYHVRFRRMLAEESPTLLSLDGYALAEQRRYAEADPADVFAAIRAAREQTLGLIEGLTEAQLRRTGLFAEYGRLSVKALIHYLCSHDQQHLAGIQWLLGKIESQSAYLRSAT
ncbi:MAG TPA: DinB family protein [Pyrinomonadaceae bacterium]|nr:DinB family protein [Pyrinomonadaceae bacterium]